MSFKKWTTAKIDKKKKFAHHLDRQEEPVIIKESLEDGEPLQNSDEKSKKSPKS